MKKMDEWKKIKSARSDEEQSSTGRRDSAETIYQQNYAPRWKALMDEKEFQPLDRVIAMIEREQQRLEKQREKLLDKKSRYTHHTRPESCFQCKLVTRGSKRFFICQK